CFFFQAEDGIRDFHVTGVQTCALPDFYRIQQARERKSQSHPRPEGKRLIGLQEEAPAAQVLARGEEPLAIRQHDPQDEGQPGIDTLLLIRVPVWQGLDLARKIAGPAGTLAGGVFVDNRMIGALEAALPWRTPSSPPKNRSSSTPDWRRS